jgi:hypothetical protein
MKSVNIQYSDGHAHLLFSLPSDMEETLAVRIRLTGLPLGGSPPPALLECNPASWGEELPSEDTIEYFWVSEDSPLTRFRRDSRKNAGDSEPD